MTKDELVSEIQSMLEHEKVTKSTLATIAKELKEKTEGKKVSSKTLTEAELKEERQ